MNDPLGTAPRPLLTQQEVARILGVSPKTVQRLVGSGSLPVIRIGSKVRVHPDDLERFIASRRGAGHDDT